MASYAESSTSTATPPHAAENPSNPRQSPSKTLATSLLHGCRNLLSELETFQSHLTALGKPNLVELRQFKSVVRSELKSLEKLSEQAELAAEETAAEQEDNSGESQHGGSQGDDGDEHGSEDARSISDVEARLLHSLRSSNLPFHSTVWNVSKTMCTGLVAFGKRFYWFEPKGRNRIGRTGQDDMATLEKHFRGLEVAHEGRKKKKGAGREASQSPVKKKSVLVDIVADNGEEWVKVSTITQSRLLFELAKLGWEAGGNSESELEDDRSSNERLYHESDADDDGDMVEMVKLAADMKKAAALVRVRYKHPRIRFILPKIVEGQLPEVDKILRDIRKTGAIVQCGTESRDLCEVPAISKPASRPTSPAPPLGTVLPSLLPDPYPGRTAALNVDCTLLLALVSDVSHMRNIEPSPSHHRVITRQIEMEATRPLVPSELWPVIGDKVLFCTEEARKRMQEIVSTIGTDLEKTRTELMMGETDGNLDRDALISQFQQLSDHKVPADWNIPIQVVDSQAEIERGWESGGLPSIARKVEPSLSDINKSVFLYGWASGLMTVSSNRTVVKEIEALIEEHREGGDDVTGPNVWVCDTARSLVGKEHNRRS